MMRPTIIATFLLAFFSLAASAADQGRVENQFFTIRDFALTDGTVMPEVKIAYETYGTLAPNGRNAVLITHGFTSSHHAAGRNPANGDNPGWWDGLIGPGKTIDTDKLFVVSSNALGSSAGSTNGASLNPATGKPYGSGFPAITMRDIIAAQKSLLDSIGVKHLGGVAGVMTEIRVETLKLHGIEATLAEKFPDPAAREAEIRRIAEKWAGKWDANSLIILHRATLGFDTMPDFPKIKAKLLYVLSRTDKLSPPTIAPDTMKALKDAGVDARYVEIDSEFGHFAGHTDRDWAKWAPALREFLAPLVAGAS